jgi:hypothetical protein
VDHSTWGYGGMILSGKDEVREQKPPQMAHGMSWDATKDLRDEKPPNNKLTGAQRRSPGNRNTKL